MKYLTHYDNFVHYIDFKKLLKEFDDKNFTFFNTNAHAFFIQNQKHISDLFKDYEYNGEYIFIMLAFEMHVASQSDPQIIDDKCKNNIVIDVNKKRHDKKFLCLNGRPKYFRRKLTDFFIDNDLIKDSSYSFRDDDITLTYDNKFNDYYYDDDQVSMKKWKTKDLNVNLVFDEEFSYQNSIYVVTECYFDNDLENCYITEKTFKAMLWKMPFIIVGQPYILKVLKKLGYKTFNHMWDEDYDSIIDPHDRMRKIQQLILNLSKRDLKKLISENYEILEHNYNNLMSRRPEKELLDTMRSLS